jgi:hypothetical protein
MWGEMKQNAAAMSADANTGVGILYQHFIRSEQQKEPLRIHLVGHSAGSIVHSHIIKFVCGHGMKIDSVSFMAPAVRLDTFNQLVAPRLQDRSVKRYLQLHLTEKAEEDDPTCGPYKRSLLHLVSASFEGGGLTPILGMEKFYRGYGERLKHASAIVSPGPKSASTTHGGFDDDELTQSRVIEFIQK